MSSIVHKLLKAKQYVQRTDEWYHVRHNILTASSIASALEANPYFTKLDLLIQKTAPLEITSCEAATNWGVKYEPVAINIYEELYEEHVHEVGLFLHPTISFLGASPDGLCGSGKLLEIKCVWNRKITDEVPLYYWMQVQLQMEVCDIDTCDLFQCKFIEYRNKKEYMNDTKAFKKGEYMYEGRKYYWKLEKYSIHSIARDKKWFQSVLPSLETFWNDVLYYKRVGSHKLSNYQGNVGRRGTKRTYSSRNEDSRRLYLSEDWSNWVRASSTKNYMLNDPLLDWLNMYGYNSDEMYMLDENNDFNDHLVSKEKEFRIAVHEYFNKHWKSVFVADMNEKFSIVRSNETISEMMNGTPIIINGLLHNRDNSTYGIPDILIRTDYLRDIFGVEDDAGHSSFVGWHYRVVTIKYQTITLGKNNILNNNNAAVYKSEAVIHNDGLAQIMGYTPDNSYIIARKYRIGDNKCNNPFGNIGAVHFKDYDNDIVERTYTAIDWIRDLKTNGEEWNINKPHRWELYPNMCNTLDYPWHNMKSVIAHKNKEITLLWNCGVKERHLAMSHGKDRWDKIDSGDVGFKNSKEEILNNIIQINKRGKSGKVTNITSDMTIDRYKIEFFVDFETANNSDKDFTSVANYNESTVLDDFDHDGVIYMIGCGHTNPETGEWNFQCFVADILDTSCEKQIIVDWMNHMDQVRSRYRVRGETPTYCWSHAEKILLRKAVARNDLDGLMKERKAIKWFDLLAYFKKNGIVVKGSFNYSLKSISGALYRNRLIETKWVDGGLNNGASSIVYALRIDAYCRENDMNMWETEEMKEIIDYNEVDCKVLWEILSLF